jgi:hypothetical protein
MTTPVIDEIDPTPYVTSPKVDALSGQALATALLAARPLNPTSAVSRYLDLLTAANEALGSKTRALFSAGHKLSTRDADHHVDAAWGAFQGRLGALASLAPWQVKGAARAAELNQRLFGQGMGWLSHPYAAEWATSKNLLDTIAQEHLEAELADLIGPVFLPEVQRAHVDYGVALGITEVQPEPVDTQVLEPLKQLRKAIAGYALAVVVMGNEDQTVRAAAIKALKPIDDARAAAPAAKAAASPEPTPAVTPSEPVKPPTP